MKNTIATTALILVAGLSAGSSFAARTPSYVGEGPFYAAQSTAASLSRSAVKAEYLQARKDNSQPAFGEAVVFSTTADPTGAKIDPVGPTKPNSSPSKICPAVVLVVITKDAMQLSKPAPFWHLFGSHVHPYQIVAMPGQCHIICRKFVADFVRV